MRRFRWILPPIFLGLTLLASTVPAYAGNPAVGGGSTCLDGGGSWSYLAHFSAGEPEAPLIRFHVDSACLTTFGIVQFSTDAGLVTFAVSPGAARTFARAGLEHLGLYELLVNSAGNATIYGAKNACAWPVNYLILPSGFVRTNPCP